MCISAYSEILNFFNIEVLNVLCANLVILKRKMRVVFYKLLLSVIVQNVLFVFLIYFMQMVPLVLYHNHSKNSNKMSESTKYK